MDPSFKGAVFRYTSVVYYLNRKNKQNYTLNILEEFLLTNQFVFYFSKNFYLVDEINEKISQLKSNGLIEHLQWKYFTLDKKLKDYPSMLTLENLSGIFKLLAYGLAAAMCALVIELVF